MKIDVYGDESSHSGHRYMVLGALVVPTEHCSTLIERVRAVRNPRFRDQEIKWTKLSASLAACYTNIIDEIFSRIDEIGIAYHSLIVNCSELDHRRFNDGDRDLGFNKFNYQLLVKIARYHGKDNKLYVYLDQRTTVHLPNELGNIVNAGVAKRWNIGGNPVRKCVHRASKTSTLIQVADLITGALAFHKNGHDRVNGASPHKTALANHIARKIGRTRLGSDTPKDLPHFTVWNLRLQR